MSSATTPTVIRYMMAALARLPSIDDAIGAVQGHLSNAYDLAMRKQRPTDQIVDCGVRALIYHRCRRAK